MDAADLIVAQRIADLKSGNHGLAWDAAADLIPLGPVAEPAVPALIDLLLDRQQTEFGYYAKGMGADALGAIGPAAQAAIPALLECTRIESDLPEEGRWLKLRAAAAIFRINGDPQAARQVASELLHDAEWWLRDHASNLLEKIDASI